METAKAGYASNGFKAAEQETSPFLKIVEYSILKMTMVEEMVKAVTATEFESKSEKPYYMIESNYKIEFTNKSEKP
jgi:hypothetical protein